MRLLIPKTASISKNYSLDSDCETLYSPSNQTGAAKTAGVRISLLRNPHPGAAGSQANPGNPPRGDESEKKSGSEGIERFGGGAGAGRSDRRGTRRRRAGQGNDRHFDADQ